MLIFLCELTIAMMPAGNFPPDKVIGGSTAKAQQIAMKPIPNADYAARSKARCKLNRQWAMTGTRDIFEELLFVRRENADAAPTA
ncbi:MAG: hypothetical protein KGR98_01155 [Verrucomicrobia bacterium]|nr:hypothetical protein [Verrucomicrobiota bacterium]